MVEANQPIDVIVVIDKQGKMIPIKIRVTDKSGETQTFSIKVVTRDIANQGKGCIILKFICRFAAGTILRECELHFRIQETKWFLYRIIK